MEEETSERSEPISEPISQPIKPTIVAIGASAGGVVALQQFFDSLPDHSGAAFVVVVHLDPERRSELPSILAARTKMPVVQVNQSEKLRADHVYVIPPIGTWRWWTTRFRRSNSTSRAASGRLSTCSFVPWRSGWATVSR